MTPVQRAIAALTYDEIEQHHDDGRVLTGIGVPLLQRSIANDLRDIERAVGGRGGTGRTRLSAIAEAIDEALLALAEVKE